MTALSASRPWIVYWLLHATDLLSRGDPLPEPLRLRAATTVLRFQHPSGGFGGGVGQRPHLAATYAAVHALGLTRDTHVWERVDRAGMYRFLMRCKQPDGSFVVCEGGEVDLRGTYCALTVARLLNIVTPELTDKCIDFIARCQSHDGGLAAIPHSEAHGGYTFCGLAAALVLGQAHMLDLDALLGWCIRRQMPLEGGFQGRPNKLVDGCYSWWVGGVFELLDAAFTLRDGRQGSSKQERDAEASLRPSMAWNRQALQEYILLACQSDRGGLIDKPGKYPDPYHTCYVLSGLAAAQYAYDVVADDQGLGVRFVSREGEVCVVGPVDNLLHPVDPIHNVRPDVVEEMGGFFRERPLDLETLKGE
ncbi:terpenoid cyclases/protein prenyltransferase alpha-alpha toroid [Catenaria anguillulae PL171]|uniref:Protein farnesyltransferase subunit beta n=1 Tax=Catenaria anguillulae PL171 TaxID=765915 RepID=A0A1Y2HEZ1_9FUNG|nr:terpenoid cyclases/protein prenyltransferase alpha-alpha toroid [Catenaria anguillulae PL171]